MLQLHTLILVSTYLILHILALLHITTHTTLGALGTVLRATARARVISCGCVDSAHRLRHRRLIHHKARLLRSNLNLGHLTLAPPPEFYSVLTYRTLRTVQTDPQLGQRVLAQQQR